MTNQKKMINCFVCGSWIKPNKDDIYKCPKCKAKYIIEDNEIKRHYENYKEYVND